MRKVYLQYWEESERGWGVRPDGCSLHMNNDNRDSYIKSIYESRDDNVPDEYDRFVGNPIEVSVSDSIYNEIVENNGSIRLMQHSLTNCKLMGEIKI
jgi:hypothetical protein